jgi:hypothetical protein
MLNSLSEGLFFSIFWHKNRFSQKRLKIQVNSFSKIALDIVYQAKCLWRIFYFKNHSLYMCGVWRNRPLDWRFSFFALWSLHICTFSCFSHNLPFTLSHNSLKTCVQLCIIVPVIYPSAKCHSVNIQSRRQFATTTFRPRYGTYFALWKVIPMEILPRGALFITERFAPVLFRPEMWSYPHSPHGNFASCAS